MQHPSSAPFLLGVNYPWLNYGEDFGRARSHHSGISLPENRESVDRDFAQISKSGAAVVRWFLFGDGRGGFRSENGIPRSPDDLLFTDVAAALELARTHHLQLCLSLIDFLWLQDRAVERTAEARENVLHFAAGREAFLQNVLIPLFREFRSHPALFAWEIANEPEWAIREFHRKPAAKMHFADFRAYAQEIALAVHQFGAVPVTLGSARLIWVRAWTELGLDYYQAHYYPSAESETNQNLAQQLASLPALDKPLWLGELPARDPSDSRYSLQEALSGCRSAGLSGAAVWRWTTPAAEGTDVAIGQAVPAELRAWVDRSRAAAESA
jgi:hypothetical protein